MRIYNFLWDSIMILAEKIKMLRKKKKISQGQLAEAEGIKVGGELDDVKGVEVSLVFGGGLAIPVGELVLFAEGRFDIGVTRIDDSDTGDGVMNTTISLDAGIGIPF